MRRGKPLERRTPLRADPAKTREWQQRSRSPLGSGGTPLKRTEMSRKPTKKKTAYEAELDALTPDLVLRSRGVCEANVPKVCTGNATHRHHRKLGRGKGTQDSIEALMHLCDDCHDYCHLHRTWAREMGFIIRRSDDPKAIPFSRLRKVT